MTTTVAAETIELQTIQCGDTAAVHNDKVWSVRTNRHPETNGSAWGWIDGPKENICWSDNIGFNCAKASEVCRVHNQWVIDQKSIDMRLNDCGVKVLELQKEWQARQLTADTAWRKYQEALSDLRELKRRKANAQ